MGQYPDGLRGPLIVHDPNDPYAGKYDEEVILTVSDWWVAPCLPPLSPPPTEKLTAQVP